MAPTVFHPLWVFLTNATFANAATILGTVLAIIGVPAGLVKWLLSRRKRLRLETVFNLSGPDQGNTISVINNSETPVLISYWELVWRKRRLWFEKRKPEADYDFDGGVRKIDAHDVMVLSFLDGNYFQWGRDQAVHGKLYLKVWVTGRRGYKSLMVYDPSK